MQTRPEGLTALGRDNLCGLLSPEQDCADLSAYVAQQYGQYDQARSPRDHDPE